MPMEMTKFKDLPAVEKGKRRGGKKCDWAKVYEAMHGKGGFTKKEVHLLTIKAAVVEIEQDDDGNDRPPVGEFRTGRWLQEQIEKDKMEARVTEDGTYVYMAIGIIIPPST